MFYSPYSFVNIYPSNKSIKLLLPIEKQRKIQFFKETGLKMNTIYLIDPYCVFLNAKVGDIVCIRNNITEVYRYVI
jgi:hypothetical protein